MSCGCCKNKQGLGGFFGWLWNGVKKNAGTIIGTAVGGILGFAIGRIIDHYLIDNTDVGALRGIDRELTPEEEKSAQRWLDTIVKPWLENIFDGLNNDPDKSLANSSSYRNKINQALKILGYSNMYYQAIGDDVKAEIIVQYYMALREAYIEMLKQMGIQVYVQEFSLNSSEPLYMPEPFDWKGKKYTSKIELFAEKGKEPSHSNIFDLEYLTDSTGSKIKNPLKSIRFSAAQRVGEKLIETKKNPSLVENPSLPNVQSPSTQTDINEREDSETSIPAVPVEVVNNNKKGSPDWLMPAVGTTLVGIIIGKILK